MIEGNTMQTRGYPTREARTAVPAVLAIPAFRRLWFAQILSMLALNVLVFLLALIVYQNTRSNAAVSGLFLAYSIPAILFGMVGGVIVDQLDRRIVLFLSDFSRAIIAASLLFSLHSLIVVYLFIFLHAAINQFYVPAEAPTIPKLVPASLLVAANGLFSFTYYGSMAVGFVLAGPMLRLLGAGGSLVFVSLLFVLAALNVWRIPSQGEGLRSLAKVTRSQCFYLLGRLASGLTSGIHYVTRSRALFEALCLLTATQIVIAILAVLGPGFADTLLKIDVSDASLVIVGPVVVGIVVGSLWVGNIGIRLKEEKLTNAGVVAAGFILCTIAVTVRLARVGVGVFSSFLLPLELFLFFLLGVANSLLDVPANTLLQRQATETMRGRVYGFLATAVGGVGILPVVLGGVLADSIGIDNVIVLLGLVILLYGISRMYRSRANGV